MADVRDKLVALHSLVETTLQAHDANFNVYDRPRQLFLDAKSRAKRVSIMGDPIRYAEVTLDSIQADAEPMTRLADGRAIQAFTTQAGRGVPSSSASPLKSCTNTQTAQVCRQVHMPNFLMLLFPKTGPPKA